MDTTATAAQERALINGEPFEELLEPVALVVVEVVTVGAFHNLQASCI